MARLRIGIAHRSIAAGDAVGNDMAGAYRLLEGCGYEPWLVGEHVPGELEASFRTLKSAHPHEVASGLDLLLYHHSIHWPAGEELIRGFAGPVVIKYHNITPAEYFERFSATYHDACQRGREQTARIATLPNVVHWQCDSGFNSEEVGQAGVGDDRRSVVPPFNRIDEAFAVRHDARYRRNGPFHALFVGRRAPNKGHVHLLRVLAAWRELYPEARLVCRIVGSVDRQLSPYLELLQWLEQDLHLDGHVEWLEHVTDAQLQDLFTSSHAYLNLSEHEGFCVPLVEAQAVGLPTISTDAGALRETAGAGQITIPVPCSQRDYDLVAGLLHRVLVDSELRGNLVKDGSRNAFSRFTSRVLEDAFLRDLEPVLRTLER